MLNGIPVEAGIYVWYNKVNDKCYVGQAHNLHERIKQHLSNFKENKENKVLYSAINKYGLENFEVLIVTSFPCTSESKKKLDELEKYYIERYNCYNCGYNCTLGGEGLIGYVPDQSSMEIHRQITRERAHQGQFLIFIKDIQTGETKTYITSEEAAEELGTIGGVIRPYIGRGLPYKGRYLIGRNEEELQVKERVYYTEEELTEIILQNKDLSINQIAIQFNTTYYQVRKCKNKLEGPGQHTFYRITKDRETHIGKIQELSEIIGVARKSLSQAINSHINLPYRGWKIEVYDNNI